MTTFTVFLLKPGLNQIQDAIDPDKSTTEHPLVGLAGVDGSLFLGPQNTRTPEWVATVTPFLNAPINGAISASRSAVLIVTHGGRKFAITFGHGKSLLNANAWERGFGLKVTLNRVNPDALRSIDSKTYEDLVVSTRTQTSKTSSLGSFDLDVGRILVRGVAGDAQNNAVFKRFVGADALRVTTTLSFANLPQILTELTAAYTSTAYRSNFGWIDNIKEADPSKHAALDARIVHELQAGGGDAYLAPADVVNWDEIEEFNYTGGNQDEVSADLSLPIYLAIVNRRGQVIDIEHLKSHRVKVRYENGADFRAEWSIYDCLVWETQFQGKRYVLFDGRWFQISATYVSRVEGFVTRISAGVNPTPLPDANPDEPEGDYNIRAQAANAAALALLDREPFRPSGATSSIEFCDLFSNDRKLIHVKKRSSSATLSHLFSQGSVSGDLFLNDKTIRTAVRRKLTSLGKAPHAALVPVARPTPNDFEIVYAVIAPPVNGQFPPRFPFFSAVNLMHHGTRIEGLGYRLSLQFIRQL